MAEEKNMENSGGLGATGNFIHSYIQDDLKGELNKIHTAGAERLSAHWSCKVHLPEFRACEPLRRQMQSAL